MKTDKLNNLFFFRFERDGGIICFVFIAHTKSACAHFAIRRWEGVQVIETLKKWDQIFDNFGWVAHQIENIQ